MNRLKNVFIFLILVGSLCLEQIVVACGGGEDPYYDSPTFFHNNTTGPAAYMPFYFIAYEQYYGMAYDATGQTEPADLNLDEWIAFSNKGFNRKDAGDFIYRYAYQDLSNLYYHIEKGNTLKLPDSVQENSVTQWFLRNKDLEALGYLMFAKKCEDHAVPASDWEAPARNVSAMQSSIKGGLQLWKASKKDFFKWRYAYQVLRMAFYSGDYTRTNALYQELVGSQKADNVMYYRCLSIKAGAAYKSGDYNTAAYLYSLAFQGTDDQKFSNYVSYNWCFGNHGEQENGPKATRKAVLALATGNSEKAGLSLMDALHNPENALPMIKEAYRLDPTVKGLDVAMTREVNKMEKAVLDPLLERESGFKNYYYTYNNYFYNNRGPETPEARKERMENEKVLKEVIAFGKQVYNDKKVADAGFWPLAIGYLYFIQQEWANCESWMAKAEQMKPQGRVKDMLMIEQLLLAINKNKTLDAATEASILPSLQWLGERAQKDDRFDATYHNLMTTVLPNVYIRQQDTMKALLCLAKGETGPAGLGGSFAYWYDGEQEKKPVYVDPGSSVELEQVSTAQIISLKTWIRKAQKTPYEQFLVKYEPYQAGALDLYIASRYIRQMDFAKAADILKSLPAAAMERYSFQDPFADRYMDTQEPEDTIRTANRYTFARDMQSLQERLDKAPAEDIYRYANGLYSMTYYGLSWIADMNYRSGSDDLAYYADTTRDKLLPEYKRYYSAEQAKKYYQMALDKSTDNELSAKCLFMLSKCWQKNATGIPENRWDPTQNNEYYLYTLKSPYFLSLNKNYNQTKTFKKCFEECSYLKLYVRRMNKQ